jgi:hypothetical protein
VAIIASGAKVIAEKGYVCPLTVVALKFVEVKRLDNVSV